MLRISKLADYGTVVMVNLTKQGDALSSARSIAEQTRLTLPTVSKLLKQLTAAELLVSVRGANGGYKLSRKPEMITVAQIIYALEDQRGLTECSVHAGECSLQGHCAIQGNWRSISHAIETALDSVSLADFAKPKLRDSQLSHIKQLFSGENCGGW